MADEYAQFLTPWGLSDSGDGEVSNSPALPDKYPFNAGNGIRKWQDITGQPSENLWPDPNCYIIETWADTATMDAITADTEYVILRETRRDLEAEIPTDPDGNPIPVPSEVPTQAEYDDFRLEIDAMTRPITQTKVWEPNQIVDALGTTVDGRTWEQINADLKTYCNAAQKGTTRYNMRAVDLGNGDIGFSANPGGELEPMDFFGIPIGSIKTNATLGGVLAFKLNAALTLPQDYIQYIEIFGLYGEPSREAFYNPAEKQWVWFDVGDVFKAGEDYTLVVAR